jgi:hypothetical protein
MVETNLILAIAIVSGIVIGFYFLLFKGFKFVYKKGGIWALIFAIALWLFINRGW